MGEGCSAQIHSNLSPYERRVHRRRSCALTPCGKTPRTATHQRKHRHCSATRFRQQVMSSLPEGTNSSVRGVFPQSAERMCFLDVCYCNRVANRSELPGAFLAMLFGMRASLQSADFCSRIKTSNGCHHATHDFRHADLCCQKSPDCASQNSLTTNSRTLLRFLCDKIPRGVISTQP
jgi:hypothetical protein